MRGWAGTCSSSAAALAVVGVWRAGSSIMAYAWSAEVLTRYGNLVTWPSPAACCSST
jgi:hypothetical protein